MLSSTKNFSINSIGTVRVANTFSINIFDAYKEGLINLEGFSHVIVLWVAHTTNEGTMILNKPYTEGPDQVGIFSTRSASRPNRLGMSVAPVTKLDLDRGTIELAWIDAIDKTPVADIKPYFPASDRVNDVQTPSWCSEWPQNLEASATFDWEAVFN